MNRIKLDQIDLVEPDEIYGQFELIRKENRKSYFLSKEEAKKMADFIYEYLNQEVKQ
jgi:hypothetical protein